MNIKIIFLISKKIRKKIVISERDSHIETIDIHKELQQSERKALKSSHIISGHIVIHQLNSNPNYKDYDVLK